MRPGELDAALDGLRRNGCYRQPVEIDGRQGVHPRVDGRELLSFASNDYLGLAGEGRIATAMADALRDCGVGSGASRLLSGGHLWHRRLEEAFADFVGRPAALLFGSGYLANVGVLPALLGRGGWILQDRLAHASLVDGARLAGARLRRFPHNDVDALGRLLAEAGDRPVAVVTESVFSMDGDRAELPALLELCRRHDAWLLVDDAHGFGLDQGGRGAAGLLPHDERLLIVATLGKAMGVAGALLAGGIRVVDWLRQRARSHMFATAMPPALAAAGLTALELVRTADDARVRLAGNIALLRQRLGARLLPSDTPIQPWPVGGNEATMALAGRLMGRGVLVGAVRPPTVPAGTARLRLSLSAAHTPAEVARLADLLLELTGP